MRIHVIGVDHERVPLTALASLDQGMDLADFMLAEDAVAGAVQISTCNRFELVVEADEQLDSDQLLAWTRARLRDAAPDADQRAIDGLRVLSDEVGVRHVFEVAAGLRSAVVGDQQVAGQVRRAYESAADRGFCSASLHRLFHDCLRTSRAVASGTRLSTAGRSAAAVGLDLALADRPDLSGRRALLIGTGSFARIVVTELAARGPEGIDCWSPSGRAQEFAVHHPVRPLGPDELVPALRRADLIVTCSGHGVTLDADTLLEARPDLTSPTTGLVILDLSLTGDLSEQARALPGIRLVRLDDIRQGTSGQESAIEEAERLVERGLQEHLAKERARAADPITAALRAHVDQLIDAEVARCRTRESVEVCQAVERSLRHVAGVLLHTPMVRAAQLAEQDRLADYVHALDTLFGAEVRA